MPVSFVLNVFTHANNFQSAGTKHKAKLQEQATLKALKAGNAIDASVNGKSELICCEINLWKVNIRISSYLSLGFIYITPTSGVSCFRVF